MPSKYDLSILPEFPHSVQYIWLENDHGVKNLIIQEIFISQTLLQTHRSCHYNYPLLGSRAKHLGSKMLLQMRTFLLQPSNRTISILRVPVSLQYKL